MTTSSLQENRTSLIDERRLASLSERYQALAAELAEAGFVLKGTVVERYIPCRHPGCRCKADPPSVHGPYWEWSTKVNNKTVTRRISKEQAIRYQEWIDRRKRVERTLEEMYEVSSQAAAIIFGHKPPDTGAVRRPR